LRDARAKTELAQPIDSSSAATIAAAEDKAAAKKYFNARFADNFDGINWAQLLAFIALVKTQKQKKS
jgi:hypothetical protein